MLEDGGCIYKDTSRHNQTRLADDILGDGGMNSGSSYSLANRYFLYRSFEGKSCLKSTQTNHGRLFFVLALRTALSSGVLTKENIV